MDWTLASRRRLLWRIGLPVSAMILCLLAIPMSSFNPRVGRSVNLFAALFVYVTYSNAISLCQAWVAQEKISFAVGVVPRAGPANDADSGQTPVSIIATDKLLGMQGIRDAVSAADSAADDGTVILARCGEEDVERERRARDGDGGRRRWRLWHP